MTLICQNKNVNKCKLNVMKKRQIYKKWSENFWKKDKFQMKNKNKLMNKISC